jgi:hypothetical protein
MRGTSSIQQPRRTGPAISTGILLLTLALAAVGGCGAPPRPAGITTSPHRAAGRGAKPPKPGVSATPPGATQAAAQQNPVTRSLSQTGPGWALAEFGSGSATVAGPVTLDLVDPAGHTYPLYNWTATTQPWSVLDWSGDRSRVLLAQEGAPRKVFGQLTLATGQITTFMLPTDATVLGYTRPSGENILVADNDGIARYNVAGVLQQQLITGSQYNLAISSPDGQTEVVNGGSGLVLVRNSGSVIRQLPVPGVDAREGCAPVRWWDATTVLARCTPTGSAAPQVWLVPLNGAARALTPVRDGGGPDLGDLDAWQLPTGVYTQGLGGCGTVFIGHQSPGGTVTEVNVPGGTDNNLVVAASGSRLMVLEVSGCTPSASLVWLNPASGAEQNVLMAPAHDYGVMAVVPFNGDGKQALPVTRV